MPRRRQRPISDEEYALYDFQIEFLKAAQQTATTMHKKPSRPTIPSLHASDLYRNNTREQPLPITHLVTLVMKQSMRISSQMMEELFCELNRVEICYHVEQVRNKSSNGAIIDILRKIETIMDPTIKFDNIMEKKVKDFLKQAESYVGSLGITDEERKQIVKAIGLTPGHWYACPKGHVYCIADCGGAVEESICPECKARIGGTQHRLRSDNRVATEMDGAVRSAYPGGI